ncbi:MAG: prepilin-type N-terminal cleavage/methylation domain-containing protein [Desulfobacteraceae bacterium]|jgi:prepilin-type N-terminal cleavage/methylation domain-containing protein
MIAKHSGFTLLEAAITMAIAGIVMLGAPPVWQWLRTQGPGHAVDQLTADLQLARMTAIRKRTRCALQMNMPGPNQYQNSVSGRITNLSAYRGGIHFLPQGPKGYTMATHVTFNQQGMSTSVVPKDLFVTNRDRRVIYRVRVLAPGGICVYRWSDGRWH